MTDFSPLTADTLALIDTVAAAREQCRTEGHIYAHVYTSGGIDVLECTCCTQLLADAKIVWYASRARANAEPLT